MKILLIGGGNSTHIFSVLARRQGHDVTILTRNAAQWSDTVTVYNWDTNLIKETEITSSGIKAIDDYALVDGEYEMIVLAGVPVEFYEEILVKLEPYVNSEVYLGSVCAYGGFQLIVKRVFKSKYPLIKTFGFQSIPWTCGIKEYGKSATLFGGKPEMHVACSNIDAGEQNQLFDTLSGITSEKIVPIDFLTVTLWPNNPLFHVPVLYGIFKDWDGESWYEASEVPLRIYADVTEESAGLVESVDAELQCITKKIRTLCPDNSFLDYAKPLTECLKFHYKDRIGDDTSMFTIFRTNEAYKAHKIKYITGDDGRVKPDISHKFFTTDTPFGLCLYKDLADTVGVETPVIDKLIRWNQGFMDKEYMVGTELVGRDSHDLLRPSKEYLE
jgi:hypothetical protein